MRTIFALFMAVILLVSLVTAIPAPQAHAQDGDCWTLGQVLALVGKGYSTVTFEWSHVGLPDRVTATSMYGVVVFFSLDGCYRVIEDPTGAVSPGTGIFLPDEWRLRFRCKPLGIGVVLCDNKNTDW